MEIRLEKPEKLLDWLRIYGLYLTAFPASERKPFAIIRNMYCQGRADVWWIRQNGEFSGFAATVNGDDLVLLDYLAVCPSRRGKGTGSAAMAALLVYYSSGGFFVEIESTLGDSPDRSDRVRRKRFYQAAGLEDLQVSARVFGVEMELLGTNCHMDFEGYRRFYRDFYNPWAAEHIERIQ